MSETALDPSVRNRLLRYLHTGNEVPKYYPGCWQAHKYFEENKLYVLYEIFSANPSNSEVVDIILKASKDGMYTRFETIAFALAKCLLLGSESVKKATYEAVAQICANAEQLLLFTKFTRLLKTGNGRGWCKTISDWYIKKDLMVLTKEITRVRARHGRSHKTLIRKSHVKVPENDFGRDAAIKYAVFGFKRAKQLVGDKPGAKDVLDYIQKVDDFRHCEDPVAAAPMAVRNKFTLELMPAHLMTEQVVWNAVIPQMSLSQLLYNIQRIHNMGFLTSDSTTTSIMVGILNNQDVIKKSKVTPLEVYITLANYRKKFKPAKHDKLRVAQEKEQRRRTRQVFDTKTGLWEWTTNRRHPKENKNWGIDLPPNPTVLGALGKLLDQSWLLTPPTNARYLITLDMRHHMFKGRHFCKTFLEPKKSKKVAKNPTPANGGGDSDTPEKKSKKHLQAQCFYNTEVTPGHAAIMMALHLLKREKNAKLAVFTNEGIELMSIERNFSNIEDTEFILRNANLGPVQMDAPIQWATKNKQQFDVFINMVDRPTRFMELDRKARGGRGPGGRYGQPPTDPAIPDHCPVRALEGYRNKIGIKDAKLIVMSLASHRVGTTDGTHEGVLDIVGIDEYVPKVIDAFTLGQFK